ncbi:MAG TPA: cyanophycinase [Candidatus Acidoferrum sp.]|nr:cyanophycinase [Candidatus Acidoferrum sp.]
MKPRNYLPPFSCRVFFVFGAFVLFSFPAAAKWKYFRTGSDTDTTAKPRGGLALMGGGSKQDPAFKFLCERANGGDFLILRANTEDDYAKKVNEEIKAICPLNSVATIVFSDREDSDDPKVAQIIGQAETIFFAGGDQSNYVRFWQDTPVQDALNRHIAAGKPIGGSSAGLAILGEFSFVSIIDTIHSPEALADPYGNKVTLSRDFLDIPLLADTITDTHFVKRDRLGRLLVFMSRILQDGWADRVRAIAVDEDAAVLVEPDGSAKIVGGTAYFLETSARPEVCRRKRPLQFKNILTHRSQAGQSFNLKEWKGKEGDDYSLSVVDGKLQAAGSNHGVY